MDSGSSCLSSTFDGDLCVVLLDKTFSSKCWGVGWGRGGGGVGSKLFLGWDVCLIHQFF